MKLYAVLGEKLSHSLSPQIHNYLFNALEIDANYSILEVSKHNTNKIIDSLKILNYSGINVTIPYKELILPYLDEISQEAQTIGAVNTIVISNDKTYGYNTDYFGFGSMLNRHSIHVENKKIVVLGAGGAAKSIIAYLQDHNASSILVVSSTESRLDSIKKQYPFVQITDYEDKKSFTGDILINATPVGMYPNTNASIASKDIIQNFSIAIDIVYNPLKTLFLQTAEQLGLTTVDGLYMLIDQAIKAEEIFQNTSIDLSIGTNLYNDLKQLFDTENITKK